MKKRLLLCLLALTLLLAAVLGMVACSDRSGGEEGQPDEPPTPGTSYDVNYYLAKVNSGLEKTVAWKEDPNDPLKEYAVQSEYTVRTDVENYTLNFDAVYGANAEKNKYYVRLFDNVNHITRVSLYYDSTDLYIFSDRGRYKIAGFNSLLLYTLFNQSMAKLDLYNFFFGEFMQTYFKRGSLLTNAFEAKNCSYNAVGNTGEALYLRDGDFSVLMSTINARIDGLTEGIGQSFDAITNNMLGFCLSKFIEYSFNSINVEEFQFLLNDGRVYQIGSSIEGRMLDGSSYFVLCSYKYDPSLKTLSDGEEMKVKYDYDALTPDTGSFEGQITFPTIREEAYLVSLDYDLDAKVNANNTFTFRIYDQKSTQSEIKDKYANISEFLSIYYTNEVMYVNAEGLCDVIGTPIELESLHLPKVYLPDLDVCSALQVGYSYLIRILNVLADPSFRTESILNKTLYNSLLEAMSSPDLNTFRVEVTEELIKNIRGDETSLTTLVSRWLTGKDESLQNVIPNDFFQLLTIFLSYKFVENSQDQIILQGVYNRVEYFNGVFYRVPFSKITLPGDLNDLYYTLFSEPEVITLDYDVTITPYHTESVDASRFFGVFLGDGTGKNTPCVISSEESLTIRGKVSESYNVNSAGEKITVTTVNLSCYRKTPSQETLLMTIISNPTDAGELLIGYYMPVGKSTVNSNIKYRISAASVKEEMEKVTGEDNLFLSDSNMAILLGLMTTLGGNSETYIRDNRYVVSIMTNDKKDPVEEMIGISDTHSILRIKMSFDRIDLSSVTARDYSEPYIEVPENVSVHSIYSDDSNWKETIKVYISGGESEMYLSYLKDSVEVKTGQSVYHPTAFLFGKEISYRLSILDPEGTYLITELLTGREVLNMGYDYSMVAVDYSDGNRPEHMLVIDPAYTKKLPTRVDVRYENFELGTVNCSIEGFLESNITRDGYNMSLLAGDYSDDIEIYSLKIGNNSIVSYTFPVYIAVLNRNVVAIKTNETDVTGDNVAYINNVKAAESVMGREVKEGNEQVTVISGKNVPVVGRISVDPYTYAMKKSAEGTYDLIGSGINDERMRIFFYGFYGTELEKDEKTAVEIKYNKYYNKEGYNYIYLSDRIRNWDFDYSLITWQGGVFYATATFGDENGYSIPIAIRIDVQRKEVTEVRIDSETNSRYTIDYLIRSTYDIPTTGDNEHTVKVIFGDGSSRNLLATRLGTLSDEEFYSGYILGSLNWAGTETLSTRITREGTSSLFGVGQNATSETSAYFGGNLGVGMQKVKLNVLQPGRTQSGEENFYLVKQYTVTTEGEKTVVTPVYGQVSVSNAKFRLNDESFAPFEINPYDFTASLPSTIWLYVNKDSTTKEWKEYAVNWQTTDNSTEGTELNIIKQSGERYVLAYPSTQQRDLAVYGCVGDGNGIIWVTMIVRNLHSELRDIKFYAYSHEKQTVAYGMEIPADKKYYEYIKSGYAQTEDERAVAGKTYYRREVIYTKQNVVVNSSISGTYYVLSDGVYVVTDDSVFKSGKEYYKREYVYSVRPLIANQSLVGEQCYELIENGYGRTEDRYFTNGKNYYLYVEKVILPDEDVLYVDPYADYDEILPKRFVAVLGSGATVTSEDLDDEGNKVGLTWYAVIGNEEYPIIRAGKFLQPTAEYNKRYDENGKLIFPWDVGNIGLKCYVVGNGEISNEAVINLIVRSRALYKTTNNYGKQVNYIDVYNNDDPYLTGTGNSNVSAGIYSGKAVGGFLDVDRYDKSSTALMNRLILMRDAQLAGKKVYVGVRFDSVSDLYSLPVTWDVELINRMIEVLRGASSLTESEKQQGGIFLIGKICADTINEQELRLPFSVVESVLSSVRLNVAPYMTDQGVYIVVNDENGNNRLEKDEMTKVADQDYNFADEYLRYIGSNDPADAYSPNRYENVIYFSLEKAYGLSNNSEGYFCTPYEYFRYLFDNLTVVFRGGMEKTAVAGDQLSLFETSYVDMTKEDAQEKVIEYFNRSVLCLEESTLVTEDGIRYSYSFIELNKFSQGSVVSRSLIVVKAALATYGVISSEVTIEPFNRNLTMVYGEDGYALPVYEEVVYTTDSALSYTVRYGIPQWDVSAAGTSVLGNRPLKNINRQYINVIDGATYAFSYTLPCSGEKYQLSVRIPQKDMGETGYSAGDDLYVVKDGVLKIDNPFLFLYYDRLQGKYCINESRIPTTITANVTSAAQIHQGAENVYTSTAIDSYEVNWNFNYVDPTSGRYLLDSSLFLSGGYFCIASFNYDCYSVYNSSTRTYEARDNTIRLYVNVAQLTYYGVENVEGVNVVESKEPGESLLNDIEIDPYESSFDGEYNLPAYVTVLFRSRYAGSSTGSIVRYTFSNLEYEFRDVKDKICQKITYDQNGHKMAELGPQYAVLADNPNTVFLKMNIYLGDGTKLGNGVGVSVTILSRIIESSRVYNNVYREGMDVAQDIATYSFIKADVNAGQIVTENSYYVYSEGRYVLTSDIYFDRNTTYYYRSESLNAEVLYRKARYYEETTTVEAGKKYYELTKASTTEGQPVSADYYRRYTILYRPEEKEYLSGVAYYMLTSDPGAVGNAYTYDYEYGYYVRSASGSTIAVSITITPGNDVEDGIYRAMDVFLPVVSSRGAYSVTEDDYALPGKKYYQYTEATVVVGQMIREGAYYVRSSGEYFTEAIGEFAPGVTYYTFESLNLTEGTTIRGRNYFEKGKDYTLFENNVDYYYAVLASGVREGNVTSYFVKNSKQNRFEQRYSYDDNEKYYSLVKITATPGYRLEEEYYTYVAGRYEPTTDLTFKKSTYYIFRPSGSVASGGSRYVYFDGFEGVNYHAEATATNGNDSTVMPVYYIDPYNSATFRLPTEVTIKFTTTDEYKNYAIRGWETYDVKTNQGTEFVRYTTDRALVSEEKHISYFTSAGDTRFYEVPSSSGSYYGYFMPQKDDYNGATYRVRGYISVGNENQYFDILIVVLNRSLRISEELEQQYSLAYDYDDPVAGLLSDIPTMMGENMFVLYDSYYLDFEQDGVSYNVRENSMYGYNNGNAPIVPTIVWNESWEYEGKEYDFKSVSLTGYDGQIYGNVYADDYNLRNLYKHYLSLISEQYETLINAWMWDVVTTGDYSSGTQNKINAARDEMEKDIVVKAYDILCGTYSVSVGGDNTTQQEYYSYITQGYLYELNFELFGTSEIAPQNKRTIILYMYDKLKESYDEWTSKGSPESAKAGRPQIYEDWKSNVDSFRTQPYQPDMDNNDIENVFNDYIRLKAFYYAMLADEANNNFSTNERKVNRSYETRYRNKLSDCVMRDVWNSIYEYASITEKSVMTSILSGLSGSDAYVKAVALKRLIESKEIEGIKGEKAEAHITIPVLEYSRMIDKLPLANRPSDWNDTYKNYYIKQETAPGSEEYVYVPNESNVWQANTYYTDAAVIYFNPFDFKSIESDFIIEFHLDYSNIYLNRVNEAEDSVTSQYRRDYSLASLKELVNVLTEEGIDSIAPTTNNGDTTTTIELTFTVLLSGGSSITFTYQNYLNALRSLVQTIDTNADPSLWTMKELYDYLMPSGSNMNDTLRANREGILRNAGLKNYYKINAELWNNLHEYYLEYSLRYYKANIHNESSVDQTQWDNLRNVYALASGFSASDGDEEYARYYEAVAAEMDRLKEVLHGGSNYPGLLPQLKSFIRENYPAIRTLDEIYADEENTEKAYAAIADNMIWDGKGSVFAEVHKQYTGDDNQYSASMAFADMYSSLNDLGVVDLLSLWESYYNDADLGAGSDPEDHNSYCYAYSSFLSDANMESWTKTRKTHNSLVTANDTYTPLVSVANVMFDFLVNYVANSYYPATVKAGAAVQGSVYYERTALEYGAAGYRYYRYHQTTDSVFAEGKTYYVKGKTPYDALVENADIFGYSSADIENGKEWVKTNKAFLVYAQSLVNVNGLTVSGGNLISMYDWAEYNADPGTGLNVFSKYGFTRDEILDAFAKYYYYLRFEQSVSNNLTFTYRLEQLAFDSCRKIKALAIAKLIENNKSRNNGVTEVMESFFRDPSEFSYNGNSADCCLASLAFVYLMAREEERTAGVFNEDYETRSQGYADSLRYTAAKDILDALCNKTSVVSYGSNYNDDMYIFTRFYRLFLRDTGDAVAYTLASTLSQEGMETLYYPKKFHAITYSEVAGDLLSCEDYFAAEAETIYNRYRNSLFSGKTFESVRYNIVERFLKDYALRSILYYYHNVADAHQRAIVEEVAKIYVGPTFDEASCIASSLEKENSVSGDFFVALLGRHDLGAGFRDNLYNSYYAFYLEEGYKMLGFAVEHSPITESNDMFVAAKERVTQYAEKILSVNSTEFNNLTNDYLYGYTDAQTGEFVEGMAHRYYRAELYKYVFDLAEGSVNGLLSAADERLKASFVDLAYDIYYQGAYGERLDSILEFIVHPGVETAYQNVVKTGLLTYLPDGNYYRFSAATVATGTVIQDVYYVYDATKQIYRVTTDDKFRIGQTYYTIRKVSVSGTPASSDNVFVPFTYYENEARYKRVKDILRATGTGKTANYPVMTEYYRDIFDAMQENLVGEKLTQFYAAVEKGIEKSVYQDIYDSLSILTLSQEQFGNAVYYYLTSEIAESTEIMEEYVCQPDRLKRDFATSFGANWWSGYRFTEALSEYLGRPVVLSDLEKSLISAVYMQQYYGCGGDAELAGATVPQTIYRFLERVAEYRDGVGNYSDRDEIDRGYLTKDNILYNDYSEVTIDYKYFLIDLLLNNVDFMGGIIKNGQTINSLSFMQSTFASLYENILENIADLFNEASNLTESGLPLDILKKSLTEVGFLGDKEEKPEAYAIFDRYMLNILDVLSHTSAYVEMRLGEINPLKEYVDRVYMQIAGVPKGAEATGISGENPNVPGQLTLAHFIREYVGTEGYEGAIKALYQKRTVLMTFYSGDHLTVASDEEELRHVVYFDAGRSAGWAEFDPTSGTVADATLTNARIYIANSRKTIEKIEVLDIRYYNEYIANYLTEYTEYIVIENKNLTNTSVTFSNGYHSDAVSYKLRDLTGIHVWFEGASSENTIVIDVLNPVLPSRVHAYGYVGESLAADLGYINAFSYSEEFYTLPFDVDPLTSTTEFSRIVSGDPAYYIVVPGDGGRTYSVQLNVQYLNRSIECLYALTSDYSKNALQGENEFSDYYKLYEENKDKNVIYIMPTSDSLLRVDHTGYIYPSELYVVYGNGDVKFYTDIKWDDSGVNYSLSGTKADIATRILSYRLDVEDGYYIVEYDYNELGITLTQYSSSNEQIGDKVRFALSGTIDWKTVIFVEDMQITSLQSGDGDTTYGTVINESVVPTNIGAIDCIGYKINQLYPEYPEEMRIVFKNESYVTVNLKQSDWKVENEELLREIVIGTESPDNGFIASFTYMGYEVRVRFGVYSNIDLNDLAESGSYINGGTIYLVYKQDSAASQVEQNYSYVYFNFGTAEKPEWRKAPLYLAMNDVTADSLKVYNGNDGKGVRGILGMSESGFIGNNIVFTIEVIDPKLFATLEDKINDFIEYDYYCYAHDANNALQTSVIDAPPSLGGYFTTDSDSEVRFEIQEDSIRYDFMNNVAYVTVLYDMSSGTDARLAFDDKGTAKYSMEIKVPLKTYLNTEIVQTASNVIFDKDENSSEWSWATDRAATDAIVWPLGKEMKASDLPKGRTVDTGFTFDFYWDLSDVNVNLATSVGYTVKGYYFASNNRWFYKELTIYIDKEDVTNTFIHQINGNHGIYIGKVYDAKYFKLDFDSDTITFLRSDGSYGRIPAENLRVEYRLASAAEESWSSTNYPINVGEYYIRIMMDDYNYLLKHEDLNGEERDYLTFSLVIEPYVVNIGNIGFLNQTQDRSIETIYSGERQNVRYIPWFRTNTEREEMYNASLLDVAGAEDEESAAKADVFRKIYERSSGREQAYLEQKLIEAEKELSSKNSQWPDYTEEKKTIRKRAYVFNNTLIDPVLPYVTVDNWFGEREKDELFRKYMNGNGENEHNGIHYNETEAKAIAYGDMYNRVNNAAKDVIIGWYEEARNMLPASASDSEICAYVYTNFFPEVMIICEVKLHIEYKRDGVLLDDAPIDVYAGGYQVEISIVPADGNYGNYISDGTLVYSTSDAKNGVGYEVRTLNIAQDTSIEYEVSSPAMMYNGTVQNPNVSPVTDERGNIVPGVTVTYRYSFLDGTILTVIRTSDGARIDRANSTSSSTYAGVRDVGIYNVRITVDGGANFISTNDSNYGGASEIEATVGILASDIFIELDDIESYYLAGVADLSRYVRIHSGSDECVCENCGAALNRFETDEVSYGRYRLVCPNCGVKIEAEFTHMTARCYCNTCVFNRNLGKAEAAVVELVSEGGGTRTYRVYCPNSKVGYLVTHNLTNLLGGEKIADLGDLILSTEVRSHYPVGVYSALIGGIALNGSDVPYTSLGSSYAALHTGNLTAQEATNRQLYGDYVKVNLLGTNEEGSLYHDSEKYASIIRMFSNYNIYVKVSSAYVITTEDGAIGINGDAELAEKINSMSDGDTAVLYLSPKRSNTGEILPYNAITIDKDINLTLVGYYNADTKEIETILSGIEVKRGTLTMRIIEVRLASNGAYGLIVGNNASTIRISECAFTVSSNGIYSNTTGIYTSVNYKDKINIGDGTRFEGLTTAILLVSGNLEVTDSTFNNNGTGIHIRSGYNDINVQRTLFSNHRNYAVKAEQAGAIILNDTFRYNNVAISIPEVRNADMYKNGFTDADGNDTNTVDIEETKQ